MIDKCGQMGDKSLVIFLCLNVEIYRYMSNGLCHVIKFLVSTSTSHSKVTNMCVTELKRLFLPCPKKCNNCVIYFCERMQFFLTSCPLPSMLNSNIYCRAHTCGVYWLLVNQLILILYDVT